MKRPRPAWILPIVLTLSILPWAMGCDGSKAAPRYTPGLGEIMTLIQMRHAKLWLAGGAKNWPLAAYEVKEIEEGLADAVEFHPTHPGAPVSIAEVMPTMMNAPLREVKAAIENKDGGAFSQAFDHLTGGCNSCHQSTSFRFNVVTRPSGDYFANQDFGLPASPAK